MQIALQLFVPDFEGAYLGPGLAWIRFSAAAKRLAPLFQLMFKQAFLAAPGMQCDPGQGVAFKKRLQALRGAPVLGSGVTGQTRHGR